MEETWNWRRKKIDGTTWDWTQSGCQHSIHDNTGATVIPVAEKNGIAQFRNYIPYVIAEINCLLHHTVYVTSLLQLVTALHPSCWLPTSCSFSPSTPFDLIHCFNSSLTLSYTGLLKITVLVNKHVNSSGPSAVFTSLSSQPVLSQPCHTQNLNIRHKSNIYVS